SRAGMLQQTASNTTNVSLSPAASAYQRQADSLHTLRGQELGQGFEKLKALAVPLTDADRAALAKISGERVQSMWLSQAEKLEKAGDKEGAKALRTLAENPPSLGMAGGALGMMMGYLPPMDPSSGM